jgi:hypothetical protein
MLISVDNIREIMFSDCIPYFIGKDRLNVHFMHVFIYFDLFYILWPVDQGDQWNLK